MTVGELFQEMPNVLVTGNSDAHVSGVSIDSRVVQKGDLFVALQGAHADGKNFSQEAIRRGAVAVAHSPNAREWLGAVSSKIYGEPSREMTLVGITGTNGKTTTAYLIEAILKRAKRNPAYLGTLGYRWNEKTTEALHTTPEAPKLQRLLAKMYQEKVSDVVLECSSHGLAQGRLKGLHLDVALFTNLTRDHLDFHESVEAYRAAKWKLFSDLLTGSQKPRKGAVLNLDDPVGQRWKTKIDAPVLTFSLHASSEADLCVVESNVSMKGIEAIVSIRGERHTLRSPLVGAFNLSNLLAALAVAETLQISREVSFAALNDFQNVPGRLEPIPNQKNLHLFVDYAHTDDALSNVLRTLKAFNRKRLLLVFGCGGDRDRGKRPKMALAACQSADVVIVTSDNPRTEDPDAIIQEIVAGIPQGIELVPSESLNQKSRGVACSMAERRAAIEHALSISRPGDVVLVAGKGHETYQEISGVRHSFDDREVIRTWLRKSR